MESGSPGRQLLANAHINGKGVAGLKRCLLDRCPLGGFGEWVFVLASLVGSDYTALLISFV